MMSDLYRDGRHYDRLYPPRPDEPFVTFWQTMAASSTSILELACGTGSNLLPLAQPGRDLIGLDLAPSMLAEGRRKAAAAGIPIGFFETDMTDFELGRRFDLIFLIGNSLCHVLTRPAFENCMACVRRHLTPTGRFVINVFVPDPALLARPATERYLFGRYSAPEVGGEVVIMASNAYQPDTQITQITTYTRRPGTAAEISGRLDLRIYFPQELDALLAYNGLIIERKLAGYDGAPFGPAATSQLVICRA